jgi:hypothetical protein
MRKKLEQRPRFFRRFRLDSIACTLKLSLIERFQIKALFNSPKATAAAQNPLTP